MESLPLFEIMNQIRQIILYLIVFIDLLSNAQYTSHNVKSIAEFIDIGVESTRIQSHY